MLRADGMDPRIQDLIKNSTNLDKMLQDQVECDRKMKELYDAQDK